MHFTCKSNWMSIYRCVVSHLQLMRLIDSMRLMRLNYCVSSLTNQNRFCCYCCSYHWLAFFLSGKIPCNCNIIGPLMVADIRERILSGKSQPETQNKTKNGMNRFLCLVVYPFHSFEWLIEVLTRSIVLPRHHPLLSPSLPITSTWQPCRNGNWFGSLGLKSYNAVATTSRNGHDKDWFNLLYKQDVNNCSALL